MIPPTQLMMTSASAVNRKNNLHNMYTPAATIVAAWMRALTGVGPSMASGSQTCNGNWALLPTAPQKINKPAVVVTAPMPASAMMSSVP